MVKTILRIICDLTNFWDTKQESQDGDKQFENLGRRCPAEVWS